MVKHIAMVLMKLIFSDIPILVTAVKYASALMTFSSCAQSAPQFGDRKSYQRHNNNPSESLHECALDIDEGADMLMVKPLMPTSISFIGLKQHFPHMPLGAYHNQWRICHDQGGC